MAGRLRPQTRSGPLLRCDGDDADSIASFQTSPSPTKTSTRLQTWTGNAQVDHDVYHKMVEEHRAAKQKQQGDELKIRQLAAQLARTEEAAKRALVRTDPGAKGSTAQALLDAQRQVQQLQGENSELCSKLARERKRAAEFRASSEDYRRRMEVAQREQRVLVRKLGETERSLGGSTAARTAARKAATEQEFWSQEAGRRFAVQQEELVALREANQQLQQQLAVAVPADTAVRYESAIRELQQMVQLYERQLAASGLQAAAGGAAAAHCSGSGPGGAGGSACGRWLLESLTEGGACYLWEPATGRVFSDPAEGEWPRPVGLKQPDAAGGMHLGVRGRLDAAFRALADVVQHGSSSSSSPPASRAARTSSEGGPPGSHGSSPGSSFGRALTEGLRQLLAKGQAGRAANSSSSMGHAAAGATVDVRDVPVLLNLLLPGLAHKEAAELTAWLCAGMKQQQQPQQVALALVQQQHMSLTELETAVREMLHARDAVRQGRDATVAEALLRVRRLLRGNLAAVAAAFEGAEGQDGCLSGLQLVHLLQQEALLADLSPDEACHLLALLHEWDLSSNDRHSLTDVYAALQLLALVRVPPGALSVQQQEGGGPWQGPGQSGVFIPERPDSRSSTATTLSHSTSTANVSAAAGVAVGIGRQAANRPGRTQQPGRRGGAAVSWEGGGAAQAGTGQCQSPPAAAGHGPSLREVYLCERVAVLEAELAAAASRGSISRSGAGGGGSHSHGGTSSGEVARLRAELGRYQARLAELENDFLSLDVVANTELTEYDAEMRKAWFTAAAFKKRYVEHKTELDTIKATADKMQAALDDTHRALQAEAARRMALEEAVAVARAEAGHAKELAASVAAERAERLKLEKEYLELQGRAFAAPGGALAEVRQLREELLAVRRERAVAEAREAELLREIASLKRQLEGVSLEEHRRLVRELAQAERQCSTMELELRAALDKLDVYRWADDAAGRASAAASQQRGGCGIALAALSGGQPDDEKSANELRAELGQLRQAMALQGDEAHKLRKLLDTEASISLEAKAALEEAQSALSAAKAEAGQQLAKLRRELDNRDEQIRKLESQLRAAYAGISRSATRATPDAAAAAAGAVRISRVGLAGSSAPVQQSLDNALETLAPHENVIEVLMSEASLAPAASLAPDATTFVAWSFYLHDSQATPGLPGHEPSYDTTVRYIVEADAFLLEYLSTQSLAFELFEARGWEVRPLGTAHLRLATLLEDLRLGTALGGHRAWHHVDVTGAGGQVLGRLRVGFRVAKPLDRLLQQQQEEAEESQGDKAAAGGSAQVQPCIAEAAAAAACPEQQSQPSQAAGDAGGVLQALTQAAKQAAAEPSQASYLLITIHRCEGLPTQQQSRWYVHYTPPGRAASHDTAVAGGASPVFDDAASWALVRSAALHAALEQHTLQVAVFDDAVEDPSAALLGLASVPCAAMEQGIPVEGAFVLVHPGSGAAGGKVWLSIKWHDPLAAAAVGARPLQQRVPLADAAAAAAAVTSSSVAAAAPVQQERPLVQQQQGQQQQMDWPQLLAQQQQVLLPSVPMLTATHLQPQLTAGHAPSVSPAAAAAVAAALARGHQPQQPLMLAAPPPGNPLAAFSKAPGGTLMLLQPQLGQPDVPLGGAAPTGSLGQPPNLRYGGVQLLLQQSLEGLPLSAPQGPLLLATRQQQVPPQQLDQGSSSISQARAVLTRVLPNPEAWGSLDTTIYFCIECLALSEDALADTAIAGRHVLLAHMLLEDFTSPVQQCTETALVTGPQPLAFSYAAAYSIADVATKAATPAGRALAAALAAAEVGAAPPLVLPVLLACSPAATVADFSQVECMASCELQLSELWAGTSGDVISREVALFPAAERAALYPSGCVGQLRVTLVAARALQTLKQQCG